MPVSIETAVDHPATDQKREQLERVAAKCRRILKKTPDNNALLLLMGTVEHLLGRPGASAEWLERSLALTPGSAEIWCRYGLMLLRQRKCSDAAAAFKRSIELNPDPAEVWRHLGVALMGSGKPQEAIEAYERALAIEPEAPQALCDLGNILKEEGRLTEARALLERAIELDPRHAAAFCSLGSVFFRLGHTAAAAELFREAVALRPDYPDALNNLGMVLRLQNSLEESIACCSKAAALRPDFPEALMNLGNSLNDVGMLREAATVLERAIRLKSDHPGLHKNLGMVLLASGRFEEGWREYEWRWQCSHLARTRRDFTEPLWKGETVEGGVLLLYAEQGFGDTIQFCRYAPLAVARGFRVVLMVQAALVRLLKTLPGIDDVVAMDEPLPAFDFQCPLMSLPLAFGTKLESIPANVPYLRAGEESVSAWGKRIADPPSEHLRVGLVWSGRSRTYSPVHVATNLRRSIDPEIMAPLLDVRGVRFFSLQKDGPEAPARFGLVDFMDECRDFADTAALIASLDLIVSVDTAVVHLAGAMGKPVWVLNRFDSCWRWLQNREDSPWYPTLRLFRQPRPGGWESVVIRVREELERHAGEPAAGPVFPTPSTGS